jgi:hypothetical protein
MPTDFHHISNLLLRRILESRPARLRMPDIEQAVGWSLDALGRDAIRDDIPASAFEARREAAREAVEAIGSNHKKRAHSALHKFWMS